MAERKRKILIGSDNPILGKQLTLHLVGSGFQVEVALNCNATKRVFGSLRPDVLILDLSIPPDGAVSVHSDLKNSLKGCSTLLLRGRGEPKDKRILYRLGPNKFLTKPLDPRELSAKLSQIFQGQRKKKTKRSLVQPVRQGPVYLDPRGMKLEVDGNSVFLNPLEFNLFRILVSSPQQMFTAQELCDAVWEPDLYCDEYDIPGHMREVRRKLRAVCYDYLFVQDFGDLAYKFRL